MKNFVSIAKVVFLALAFIAAASFFPAQPTASGILVAGQLPRPYEIGTASFYSYECANLPMANGKAFDPDKRTCASWFYRFGTVLCVKSLDTGLSTEVVVTDRGPNRRLVKKGRVIDLSKKAFEDICDTAQGLTNVVVTIKSPQTK